MKEKIIVVGAGKKFLNMRELIEKYFEIVALADNNFIYEINNIKCIGISDVLKYDNRLMLCTVNSNYVLKKQLENIGVPSERINDMESLFKEIDESKYENDKQNYQSMFKQNGFGNFIYTNENEFPMKKDYRDFAGSVDSHYFYMDILVAKKIIEDHPKNHFDIGSRIDGFISHLLCFDINVSIIDIRPFPFKSPGCGIGELEFTQSDATDLLGIEDNSIMSLSSLHAIEHFGLGRYGDTIQPNAWLSAIQAMVRVLAPGGKLYFAVPVGITEKVCFNAHRIFYPKTIIESFKGLMLVEMYILHDMKFEKYNKEQVEKESYKNYLGDYDCGIFIFTKK